MRESRQFTFDEVQRLLLKHAHEQSGRPGEWLYDKVGMSITGSAGRRKLSGFHRVMGNGRAEGASMRFPTYPPDILSRADALLSEKYPDGIVDPLLVEVACEAMMAEQAELPSALDIYRLLKSQKLRKRADIAKAIAKAIRGTE